MEELNRISGRIIDAAIRIHTALGPGLMESVYETILARDLEKQGFFVERQRWISFDFEGLWFEDVCRADLVIDKEVVVEIKSVKKLTAADKKQLLTYLKLLDRRLGVLLNFGEALMKDGIKRVINGY